MTQESQVSVFPSDFWEELRSLPPPTPWRLVNFLTPGLCGPFVLAALLGEGTGFWHHLYTATARMGFELLLDVLGTFHPASIEAWVFFFVLTALFCDIWWVAALVGWKQSLREQVELAWEKLAVPEKLVLVERNVGLDHLQSEVAEIAKRDDRNGSNVIESILWIAKMPFYQVLSFPVLVGVAFYIVGFVILIVSAIFWRGLESFGADRATVISIGLAVLGVVAFLQGYDVYCKTSPKRPYAADIVIREELEKIDQH